MPNWHHHRAGNAGAPQAKASELAVIARFAVITALPSSGRSRLIRST